MNYVNYRFNIVTPSTRSGTKVTPQQLDDILHDQVVCQRCKIVQA